MNALDKQVLKSKLFHAVTEYDKKQSKKKSYNRWALPQYFDRIGLIVTDIDNGADIRSAITAGFSGRLADACLKAVNMPMTTKEENHTGAIVYTPISRE